MSKNKKWNYSDNQFLNATKGSFRKALKLSTAHDNYLFQMTVDFPLDTDWATMYARYHPLHLAYKLAYNAWVAAGGTLSGKTLSLSQLMKLIPGKLDIWIGMTILVHAKISARFKELFAKLRIPFEKGKTEMKIGAIETLSINIGAEVALAPLKVLVDAAFTEIDTARNTQLSGKTGKVNTRITLEAARVSTMGTQFADAGILMNKFWNDLPKIETVFDLQTLRNKMQTLFKRKMKTTETSQIVTTTFVAGDEIRGKVKQVANLTDKVTLYLGSTAGGIDSTPVIIFNNHELKFAVTAFAVDLNTHRFLTAVTTGNLLIVELQIELY